MPLIEYPFSDLLSLSTLTLATASSEGEPHAAPIYFVALQSPISKVPPFQLYFFSVPDSRHSRDISASGLAAGAIYADTQDWREIHGLQLRGKVDSISNEHEWENAWQAYQKKFPFVKTLKDVVNQNRLYRFLPAWVRLVDNRQGFGHKQEWTFLDERS